MDKDCNFTESLLSCLAKRVSLNKFGIPYDSSLLLRLEIFQDNAMCRLKNIFAFFLNFYKKASIFLKGG